MATPTLIGQMFRLLQAQWPQVPTTELTVKVYEIVLSDIPDNLLRAAVVHLLSTATFRPTAAEVRKAAFELAGAGRLSAVEAWGEVKRGLGRRLRDADWSTPLIPQALRCIGGLAAFAASSVDDEPSWRARFIEAYETLAERERIESAMLPAVKQIVSSGGWAQIMDGKERDDG